MTAVEKYVSERHLDVIRPALELFERYGKIPDLSVDEFKLRLAVDGYVVDNEFVFLVDCTLKLKHTMCEIIDIINLVKTDYAVSDLHGLMVYDSMRFSDMLSFRKKISSAIMWFDYLLSKFIISDTSLKPLFKMYSEEQKRIIDRIF